MRSLSVSTAIHGRVLIRDGAPSSPWLIGFHGYAQNAEAMLMDLGRLPGAEAWNLASVQALHRFYARNEERVVASWMTRQDREQAIVDNVEYVDRVIDAIRGDGARPTAGDGACSPKGSPVPFDNPVAGQGPSPIILIGFSQGAAMAYRAGVLGRHRVDGVIALGGDIPPDVRDSRDREWPPLLIGAGATDFWYTPPKVNADVAFLESRGIPFEIVRFSGGHEWADAFRTVAGSWLARHVRA